jgi:hypothetical protein
MASINTNEIVGIVHSLYKAASTSINTSAKLAEYILAQLYDTEQTKGEHRKQLKDAITLICELKAGNI